MNWKSVSYDWNQVRAFIVTVEEGSFSKAARALGLTQPTLGRQVAGLEEALQVTLFERIGRKLSLTQAGLELYEQAKIMGNSAAQISLIASGRSQDIKGTVTISATDLFSLYHMPEIIKGLQKEAPGINIANVASNSLSDLQRREADIAVRHVEPNQPELIAKKVAMIPIHLYASRAYIDKHGMPENKDDLLGADLIGFEKTDQLLTFLNEIGLNFSEESVKYSATSGIVCWEMVKQGLGVSLMPADIGDKTPEVVKLLPDLYLIEMPIWLVTHRELKTSRRIRLVYDFLSRRFADLNNEN